MNSKSFSAILSAPSIRYLKARVEDISGAKKTTFLLDELMTEKTIFIHEPKNKEYALLDKIKYMEDAPVRTWKLVFISGTLDSIHYKTGKNKSRRFGLNNLSKGLKAYMLLLGYSV